MCLVFHDNYPLRPIVQALSLYITLSPSVLLPQTLCIGIVWNVLINICEYAKVLHTWNSSGLHTHTINYTHTHTHTHTTGDRTERGKCGYSVPAVTRVPSILEYLFSTCGNGQQRQEKCEFQVVRPPWSLSSPVLVRPLLINCSVSDLGIFHFSDILQTKNARLDNLYHLVCNFVPVSCELTPWIQSVHSSRAR